MPEYVSESFISQLKQYYEQKRAAEPAVTRGHRLRNINGGRINRDGRYAKRDKIKTVGVRAGGQLPIVDNPYSVPPNTPDNIGLAIGEDAVNRRYNHGAFNNLSVIRDFFGAGPDTNVDVLGSSGPPNVSYAAGGTSLKPTIYEIFVDASGARAPAPATHPNLILYTAYGLRAFNPAYPTKIIGSARNSAARVAVPPGPYPVCPAIPTAEIPIVQELVIFPTGWTPGITDDIGFYYMVVHHDYIGGAAIDMTCATDVNFFILGYEG